MAQQPHVNSASAIVSRDSTASAQVSGKPGPKRFVRQQVRARALASARRFHSACTCMLVRCHVAQRAACMSLMLRGVQIPDSILQDAALQKAIEALPGNYNFEVRSRTLEASWRNRPRAHAASPCMRHTWRRRCVATPLLPCQAAAGDAIHAQHQGSVSGQAHAAMCRNTHGSRHREHGSRGMRGTAIMAVAARRS